MAVVLRDGRMFLVELLADGKTLNRLEVGQHIGKTTLPSLLMPLSGEFLFVGSCAGESVLLRVIRTTTTTLVEAPPVKNDSDMEQDSDDDGMTFASELAGELIHADIYGGGGIKQSAPKTNGSGGTHHRTITRTSTQMTICDALPGHGPIADMTFILAAADQQPQLVVCTGSAHLGGFTVYQVCWAFSLY